jgi:superfamily I DNA and/or RNA helicase
MPPIVAHDWQDGRAASGAQPPAEARPYISLFEALVERSFPVVRLDESFRLHRDMAEFLRQNVYAQDGIRFHSRRKDRLHRLPPVSPYVDAALDPAYPMVVIEHTEAVSQQYNLLEVELLRPLIAACVQFLSLDGRSGLGVVVPHRAQKALLRQEFPALAEANSIDTVERFQGDERDVIIVSATASDPDYVRGEADFLLNLNRLNVAISRPRLKLIVVAARTVIDLLTSDLAVFEQSLIWKRLYHQYTPDVLLETSVNGHRVLVRGRKAD